MTVVFEILLLVTALFLIVLVLIQRGKGGGLAGAFGGMGGQSAFGTKAGDLFTRITIGVASAWILLCIGTVLYFGQASSPLKGAFGGASPVRDGINAPSSPDAEKPDATGSGAPATPAAPGGDAGKPAGSESGAGGPEKAPADSK